MEERRREGEGRRNVLEIEEFEDDKRNKASWKRFLVLFRNESITGYSYGNETSSSLPPRFMIRPDDW